MRPTHVGLKHCCDLSVCLSVCPMPLAQKQCVCGFCRALLCLLPIWIGALSNVCLFDSCSQLKYIGSISRLQLLYSARAHTHTHTHARAFNDPLPFLPPNQQRQSTEGKNHSNHVLGGGLNLRGRGIFFGVAYPAATVRENVPQLKNVKSHVFWI